MATIVGYARAPANPVKLRANFRYDINGLRAIGAMAVLAYHFDIPQMQGGFVGVDIFLAISGFLMTRIIAGSMESGSFSLVGYYSARARRIVPAFALMIATTLLFAVLIADPNTVATVARSALSSLLFVSNIHYATQGGYFAAGAGENWLLHTWTLAVEWQFCLIFPLLMLAAFRTEAMWRHRLPIALIACAALLVVTLVVASFSPRSQLYAFFLLPTRAWEFTAGACVALMRPSALSPRMAMALSGLGQAAVLASILVFQPYWIWPSLWTLVPVLGCCAIIAAGREREGWLTSAPAQALGNWSYSIYLWHWPVIAGFHYLGLPPTMATAVAGIALSIILGALSYITIETSVARTDPDGRPRLHVQMAIGMTVCIAAATFLIATDGLRAVKLDRVAPDARAAMARNDAAKLDWIGGLGCTEGQQRFHSGFRCYSAGRGGDRVLLIGDSHLTQFVPRLVRTHGQTSLTMLYRDGCRLLPGLPDTNRQCADFLDAALQEAANGTYAKVVLIGYWQPILSRANGYDPAARACPPGTLLCSAADAQRFYQSATTRGLQALAARLRELTQAGIAVAIVGPYPTADLFTHATLDKGPSAQSLYQQSFLDDRAATLPDIAASEVQQTYAPILATLRDLARASGATFVDPSRLFCTGNCSAFHAGKYLFCDSHHLRTWAVMLPQFHFLDVLVGRIAPARRPS
ncbi:N/A [soil metagenome]